MCIILWLKGLGVMGCIGIVSKRELSNSPFYRDPTNLGIWKWSWNTALFIAAMILFSKKISIWSFLLMSPSNLVIQVLSQTLSWHLDDGLCVAGLVIPTLAIIDRFDRCYVVSYLYETCDSVVIILGNLSQRQEMCSYTGRYFFSVEINREITHQ